MSDATNDARVNVYINGQSGIAEIDKLERKMKKLGLEINRVGKDSDLGKKLTQDLRAAQAEMDQLTKKIDITKLSIKQLESESRRLKRLKEMTEPGTVEFKKLDKELTAVNKRMAAVKTGLGPFGQAWKLVWDQLKGFNLALLGIFAGNMVVNFFGKILKGAGDLSDQLADIRKTTSMTTDEVKALNKELSAIDTRTSTKELRSMAIVAGQIGIAKDEIGDFVKAVDVANVALGDEFTGGAQQVAEEMGKLRNVFTDFRSDNVSKDILQISNALNVLGAEGAATGPVVAENANRIGGFGIQAGLTTGQVLGLAASMQELNITSERGSTAITRILQKMLTDVETFASVAGMSTDQFRKTLDTDLFGAFMKVVEGSKKVGTSNTALAKVIQELDVDGAGASEVMAKFGGNLQLVKDKAITAANALKSQDSILQEFTLKNENAAAAAEKIGRAISGWFTRKFLEPAGEFLVWLGKATGLITSMSEKTAEERVQLVLMEAKIKNVNTTQEERVKLIQDLQLKYPKYLGNLNAEKVSNDELSEAIRKTNKELINKIIIQRKQEEIAAQAEDTADKTEARLKKEEELLRQVSKVMDANPKFKLPQGSTSDQVRSILQQMKEAGQKSDFFFSQYNQLSRGLRVYNDLLTLENGQVAAGNRLAEERERIMKRLGITMEEVAPKSSSPSAPIVDAGSSLAPSLPSGDEEKKKAKEFKLGIDLRITELERYNKVMQEVRQEIENLHKSEVEIAVDQATEKTDALIEENSRLQSELMFSIQFGNKQEREFAQKRLRELMREETELYDIKNRKALEAEKKLEAERVKTRKEAVAKIQNELKSPMQREIDEVQTHYAELIALADKYGIDTAALVKRREALILEIQKAYNAKTEEEKKQSLERIANEIGKYGQAAQNILNPVAQLIGNAAEKQIQQIEEKTAKRMNALDSQRDRGLINEDQYQKKKIAIEKKAQKELGQQRRKQAIADRIAAQAQVVFSTAEAIAKAWAASPKTFGLPWSAAAAVMGGLQSAAIWTAPLPTYKYGGTFGGVPDGPTHENGGISLINSQTGRKVGEMEGGEPYMILSRATYANNGPLIDKLLNASMNEGGRMLTPYELMANAPMIQIPRIDMSTGSGRRIVNRRANPSSGDSSSDAPKWALMLMDKIDQFGGRSSEPIKVIANVVLRDVEETKEEYTRIQELANIGTTKATGTTKTVTRTSSSTSGAGTTTIIQGQPGDQGPAGEDGVGLGLYQFNRY